MSQDFSKYDGTLVLELAGGLGNQLFQYFAGNFLASQNNLKLKVDVRYCQYSHSQYDLTSFTLPGVFIRNKMFLTNRVRKFVRYVFDVLNNRRFTRLLFVHLNRNRYHFGENLTPFEVSQKIRSGIRITGFFANKQYLQELQLSGECKTIELSKPSFWFLNLRKQAHLEKPIMLHIRRGDFVTNQATYGLLSETYYRNAISSLPKELLDRPIWVFCDQPELIEEWSLWKTKNVTFIREEDSPKRDPAEFLKLMSLGSAIIIANSTFSFFAAALSETAEYIFCPDPPMKSMGVQPEQIYFNSWVRVPSSWE